MGNALCISESCQEATTRLGGAGLQCTHTDALSCVCVDLGCGCVQMSVHVLWDVTRIVYLRGYIKKPQGNIFLQFMSGDASVLFVFIR